MTDRRRLVCVKSQIDQDQMVTMAQFIKIVLCNERTIYKRFTKPARQSS
jgi:hypothetical protein